MSEQKISYMQQADAWLDEVLGSLEPGVEITDAKRRIKDKLLESYRNGQKACPTCHPRQPRQWVPTSSSDRSTRSSGQSGRRASTGR